MTRYRRLAYRLRWLILIVGVLCLGAGVFWLVNPLWPQWKVRADEPAGLLGVVWFWAEDEPEYGLLLAGYLGVFLLTQWLFLRPRRGLAVRLARTGRPMKRAVVAAGLVAMLLTAGMASTLLEVITWSCGKDWLPDDDLVGRALLYGIPVLVWAGWSVVFLIYWRQGDHYTQLGKMIRGLLGGSVLELIAATAVYVWNPQKEDCYCSRGSYTDLLFGGTVALWCFGPGIILLFMRERYRRAKLLHLCTDCGYDLRGSIPAGSTTCPECGAPISRPASDHPPAPNQA